MAGSPAVAGGPGRAAEDDSRWFEVAEGVMRAAPRPPTRHRWTVATLGCRLREQEAAGLCVLPAVEVVVFETFPVTVIEVLSPGPVRGREVASGIRRVETPIPSTIDVAALTP